jgi:hypothetical protein
MHIYDPAHFMQLFSHTFATTSKAKRLLQTLSYSKCIFTTYKLYVTIFYRRPTLGEREYRKIRAVCPCPDNSNTYRRSTLGERKYRKIRAVCPRPDNSNTYPPTLPSTCNKNGLAPLRFARITKWEHIIKHLPESLQIVSKMIPKWS